MYIKPTLILSALLLSFSVGATFSYNTLHIMDCPDLDKTTVGWVVGKTSLAIGKQITVPLEQCRIKRVY